MSQGTQARGIAKREAVLEAAIGLLVGRGMASVTHRSVADAAGAPLGAIRYYFSSREALLLACIERLEERRRATAEATLAGIRSAAAIGADASARSSSGDGSPARLPPADAAALVLRSYAGAELDDRTLLGSLGWIVDTAREAPSLAALLLHNRATIDAQLAAVLAAAGYPDADVHLVCAVIDGALVSAAAEAQRDIADTVIRMLASLLASGGR